MAISGITNLTGPSGSSSTPLYVSGNGTVNVLLKGSGAGQASDSLHTDDGTASTYTGTGGYVGAAFSSNTANVASAGQVRLASVNTIKWRNNANGADIAISKNASDQLVLSGFGSIIAPDGTSGAPSYSFNSSAATGMYYSGGTIEFRTAALAGSTHSNYGFRADSFSLDNTNGDTLLWRSAANVVGIGSTKTSHDGKVNLASVQYRGLAQTYFVAANFTTASNTSLQNITGLGFTFPANIAMNVKLRVDILYSIATAAVAVDFGFQDVTVAPTNLAATALMSTSATAHTEATLAASSTTTATSIVSATPSAITTIWRCQMDILVEHPSNVSSSAFNIMVKTANSADLVTVYRGSSMTLQQ